MNGRWNVGDAAKCVNVSDIRLPLRADICCGGRFLTLGRVYEVRGMHVNYGGELCLDVGAEMGGKLARRFVKVPPEELGADVRAAQREGEPA